MCRTEQSPSFVLFDETSTELVGCSVESIVESGDEVSEDHPNVPQTIANLIGTTHVFELKSNSYFEHGTFKRFTCWKVHPTQAVGEGVGSSTHLAASPKKSLPLKRLVKDPTVSTPTRSIEDINDKSFVLEDCDAKLTTVEDDDPDADEDGCSRGKKKARKFTVIGDESE